MTIQAIPTKYNGVQFRSRLEARWAAFFDLCGWRWHYEPIDMNGYIPDFILEGQRHVVVEVKPEMQFDGLCNHAEKIMKAGVLEDFLILGACLIPGSYGKRALGAIFQAWCYPDEALVIEDPAREALMDEGAWEKFTACCASLGFSLDTPWGMSAAFQGIARVVSRLEAAGDTVAEARARGLWQRLLERRQREFGHLRMHLAGEALMHRCLECGAPSFHHEYGSFRSRLCGHFDGDSLLGIFPEQGAYWNEAGNRVQWRNAS